MNNMGTGNSMPGCPVCGLRLSLSIAKGRKSGKHSIMLKCARDGRHFRGFIADRSYVDEVMARMEGKNSAGSGGREGA